MTATALMPNAAVWKRCRIELLQATSERRARVAGDLRDGLQAAPSGRPDFASGEQSSTAFIELRADVIPALANRLRVDHADRHNTDGRTSESRNPESHHHMAPEHEPIHLFWRMS